MKSEEIRSLKIVLDKDDIEILQKAADILEDISASYDEFDDILLLDEQGNRYETYIAQSAYSALSNFFND